MDAPWDAARRTRFIADIRLFAGLFTRVQADFGASLQPRHVRRGEFVFLEGSPADTFNLLAEGRIKVIRETADGREVILRLIRPGDIFGGAGSWGHTHYPASAVAQEDALVLDMPTTIFTRWITHSPEFAMAVIRELSTRLREAEARIRSLQTERVDKRIARLLLQLSRRQGGSALMLSRQELADMAGTTLSTASRTLSAWDQQGLVKAGRERVRVLSEAGLAAIAEAPEET